MKRGTEVETTIHISTGSILRVIFLVGLVAVLWFLRDIILVVLTAIVLASAIEPAIRFMVGRNIPRLLSLVLIYLLGGGFLATVFYFFIPAFLEDVGRLLSILPQYLDIGAFGSPPADATAEAARAVTAPTALREAASSAGSVVDLFRSNIESGNALHSASVFFGGLLSFVLVVVLSFYLSAQERGVENFLRLVAPIKDRTYVIDLWKRSQHKIGLWFQGQLLLGLLTGILTFLGLTILEVPNALFLAVLMLVFELIPVFGPVLAAVPGIALAYTHGITHTDPGLTSALFVAIFYFIIQQFESHLIYPLVVRKVIGIPPVLVILALVIGGKLAGFLGVLLAVPITAVLMEVLNDVAKERKIFEDVT